MDIIREVPGEMTGHFLSIDHSPGSFEKQIARVGVLFYNKQVLPGLQGSGMKETGIWQISAIGTVNDGGIRET